MAESIGFIQDLNFYLFTGACSLIEHCLYFVLGMGKTLQDVSELKEATRVVQRNCLLSCITNNSTGDTKIGLLSKY